jgi:hypothetical protein
MQGAMVFEDVESDEAKRHDTRGFNLRSYTESSPAPRPTKWLVDQNYDAESHTSANTLEHPDPTP